MPDSEYLIKTETLTAIADAIREKTSVSTVIDPVDMPEHISSIASKDYKITVTVDSGATVTATNGSVVVSGESNGTCDLTVNNVGNWTISAQLEGSESSTEVVNVVSDYTATLVFFNAPVTINTTPGAVITATNGDITIQKTADSSGVANFVIRTPGDWVLGAVSGNKSTSRQATITVEKEYTFRLSLDITATATLDDNSWEAISLVSEAGTGKNYWAVGDCKSVYLNGTCGTLALDTTLWVYILGFDHNADKEGYGITFGGFKTDSGSSGINVCLVDSKYGSYSTDGTKYFNMNHWNYYNYGGWARCDMRYDILGSTNIAPEGYGAAPKSGQVGYAPSVICATSPVENTLMSCLPADLRAVMRPVTKYTDNVGGGTNVETNVSAMKDYLPLLSEFEIFGTRTYANSYEQNNQMQYEYYSAGNSKVKKRHDSTSTSARWWERSPYYDNSSYFCRVNANGSADYDGARYSYGVAPAFLI